MDATGFGPAIGLRWHVIYRYGTRTNWLGPVRDNPKWREREKRKGRERERDRSFIPLIGYSSVQRAFESLENYRGFVPSRQRTVIRFAGDSDLLQLVLLQLVLRIYWINDSIEVTIYSRNSSGDLISDFSLLERVIILILIFIILCVSECL